MHACMHAGRDTGANRACAQSVRVWHFPSMSQHACMAGETHRQCMRTRMQSKMMSALLGIWSATKAPCRPPGCALRSSRSSNALAPSEASVGARGVTSGRFAIGALHTSQMRSPYARGASNVICQHTTLTLPDCSWRHSQQQAQVRGVAALLPASIYPSTQPGEDGACKCPQVAGERSGQVECAELRLR